MRTLGFTELASSAAEFRGALGFDVRANGLGPRRLPDWTRMQLPQPLDVMARMPSGVRLAFTTSSTTVELNVLTTRIVAEDQAPRPAVFDLCVNGAVPTSRSIDAGNRIVTFPGRPGEFEVQRGEPATVVFDRLPAGPKHCQLWLPANAYVEVRSLSVDTGASVEAPPPIERSWVHYGSSISHCMEADRPTGTWPAVAARLAGYELINLGFGGQCHLDQFVARTIRDLEADLVSLKVGINIANMDSMRERVFAPALHGFLDTLRERRPDTPILLVSPIYCPSAENHPGPMVPAPNGKFVTIPGPDEIRAGCLTLVRMREIISEVVAKRVAAGDTRLQYLDGLDLFSSADADDLPDDLHPNPAGYARMGRRFADRVFSEGGLLSRMR